MKPDSTIIGEALVAALDTRDRAVQQLRNAVAIPEEDASLDRDGEIRSALAIVTTAEQRVHSRHMDALAVAPPEFGTIGTREEVLAGPGAPGTEEPLPETPAPGDPVPQGDPSVPKRDKVPPPPAQPSDEAKAA